MNFEMARVADHSINRRDFIAASISVTAAVSLTAPNQAEAAGKHTFTILHTNDLHSNLIGMALALDYTPLSLNDDAMRISLSEKMLI